MNIKELINKAFEEEISDQIQVSISGLYERLLQQLQKPEFRSWGRYLTISQAARYLGYKSKGSVYAFCRKNGIRLIKQSSKDVKVDRHELDRIMTAQFIDDFKKNR